MLYEAGHDRKQHRRVVDQVAATLILQSFLDEKQRLVDQEPGIENDRRGVRATSAGTAMNVAVGAEAGLLPAKSGGLSRV